MNVKLSWRAYMISLESTTLLQVKEKVLQDKHQKRKPYTHSLVNDSDYTLPSDTLAMHL